MAVSIFAGEDHAWRRTSPKRYASSGIRMELEFRSLMYWLKNIESMSRDSCLWIPKETVAIGSSTQCLNVDDDIDLSPEEFDERDMEIENKGFTEFLNKDQLEDVMTNLKQQKTDYSDGELFIALNYYWANDAFIVLSNA